MVTMDLSLFGRFSLVTRSSAGLVIWVSHPVHAVLSLILSFVSTCMLMMRLQIEFMALIFVVVYVGAIAVLFLFVVMMLNLNSLETSSSNGDGHLDKVDQVASTRRGLCIAGIMRQSPVHWLGGADEPLLSKSHQESHTLWVDRLDPMSGLDSLGQVLYTTKFLYLVMAGFVLLVARVGAIVLTLQVRSFARAKRQQVYQQRSRDSSRAIMMTRVA